MSSFLFQVHQEATCLLCLDFFEQPMVLSCGHNLCRDCLAQLGPEASCPQCRAKVEPSSACPNRALANMVRLVKKLRLSEGAQEEGSGQRLCQEHGQPLQSFCSHEKSLLCPGCLEGHQGHLLLSLPERCHLGPRNGTLSSARRPCWMASWRGLPATASLAPERAKRLRSTQPRPALPSVAQSHQSCSPVRYLLGRNFSHLVTISKKLGVECTFGFQTAALLFQSPFPPSLSVGNSKKDLRKGFAVTWADRYQNYPDVPGMFSREFCVLGYQGFNKGWHWWEVSVKEAEDNALVRGAACWAVGVAKESVCRKGTFQLSPQEGIWAVGRSVKGEMVTFSKVQQKLQWSRQRLQVSLDYEAKKVEFLDVEMEASLYTFQTGPLQGETLRPFFYLGQEGVTLKCEEYPLLKRL
uniref:Uncharacterized protein n=1 Tax=Pseudonaja textilis TaxID=8673 RepID=A0A670ZQG9_PSETE